MEKTETSFEAWRFTPEELPVVRSISEEHRRYLKTLLSDAAEQKLRISLDPYKPLLFVQEDAYLRGQMDILAMLLNESQTQISRPKNAVVVPDSSQPQGA